MYIAEYLHRAGFNFKTYKFVLDLLWKIWTKDYKSGLKHLLFQILRNKVYTHAENYQSCRLEHIHYRKNTSNVQAMMHTVLHREQKFSPTLNYNRHTVTPQIIPRIGFASHFILTTLLRKNIFSQHALLMPLQLRNGNTAIHRSMTLNDETLPNWRGKAGSKKYCIIKRSVSQRFGTETPIIQQKIQTAALRRPGQLARKTTLVGP